MTTTHVPRVRTASGKGPRTKRAVLRRLRRRQSERLTSRGQQ